MKTEDKELLFRDLCARLPYGVKGRYCLYDSNGNLTDFGNESEVIERIDFKNGKIWTDETVQGYYPDEFKPYLRPLESMTEEERNELSNEVKNTELGISDEMPNGFITDIANSSWAVISFCLRKHFDLNNLIPKGLALEAPFGMYKINGSNE